ncbi:MAG: hypothetical protein C0511_02820 [Hyphomicrobium sp.]|nr:hypothetical protein [Hyphomicrobium sp.]PPC83412.1 MAG: hypothetical protein CTY40_02480 [Hyphomicrobium sp.]
MATLALAAVGAAVGSTLLPAGFSVLGATITGATIGSQLGAFAGSYVDQALFGGNGQSGPREGPRLRDLHVTGSTEGAPIPRLYGRARLGGQIIWATDFEEEATRRSAGGGGKGGLMGGRSAGETIEYLYFANFAVAVCEGEISGIGRMWADGHEIDLTNVTYRVYHGRETQEADGLIVAREGAGNAPAFRGTAYLVFERIALAPFGNRLPQLSFEVYRSVEPFGGDIHGVVLIPGSGEFVYATEEVTRGTGGGQNASENVHTRQGATDWTVSLDQLEAALPNVASASLVVSWFGTDLRAGNCQIKPGVELAVKNTTPIAWKVAGTERADAYLISQRDGRPAYGGTPSDQTVVAAIRDLKARGLSVTLTPFVLMDVPDGNTLPNPYGGASQPAYPWRGRITCHPAAGRPGTVDKTAEAASQIAAFSGTAQWNQFSLAGDEVVYSGPAEWSFRRMMLHQAWLAKAAGGVDAFVIGTEFRGLSTVRSQPSTYPFVAVLVQLAADVKRILGDRTKVLYAADWSEYFGHQPGDGTGDVYFHLDPLWASASIDAIGIDLYWPLSDWRDGRAHLDFLSGSRSIHDVGYLSGNVQGGEGYDWYYASAADRDSQTRTPITDGQGKPWVFRYKDLKSWWLNAHYDRPGGVEAAVPTAWVPQSKPFWLMEIGCPAIDKGANQPNVFVDPKSSESALPYYSRGTRDDLMQRRFIMALTGALDPSKSNYIAGSNPLSSLYGQRMVDLRRIYVYAWDTRPYPAFPYNLEVWGDGDNWRFGHWLNGRSASVPLSAVVSRILDDFGFADYDAGALEGTVPGYVVDRPMAARDALQPLELGYFFDSLETGGKIVFRHRGRDLPVAAFDPDGLVESRPGDTLITLTRGQETELPASAKISYISAASDYRQAVAEARRLTGASGRLSQAELPIVLESDQASAVAEAWLFETWAARERASFKLPPSALAIEPGDVLEVMGGGSSGSAARLLRVTEVGEHGVREIDARGIDPDIYAGVTVRDRLPRPPPPVASGKPLAEFLDLPLLRGDEPPYAGYVAVRQSPWPGTIAVFSSPGVDGYNLKGLAPVAAVTGTMLDAMQMGPEGRMDHGTRVRVVLDGGVLQSVTLLQMLAGQNAAAIRNPDGAWEVVQFQNALLVDALTYELSGLLRGQAGTERAMLSPSTAGARFVLLDGAVSQLALTASEIRLPYTWRVGPASRDIGHGSYLERQHTFAGLGLRPLSPVHVRGTRAASGDLEIIWVRRTRRGGDSWETPDVPLGEENERYEVDVMAGSAVKRTLHVATSAAKYSAAQQVLDFGAVQPTVSVRVHQVSAAYGRGAARAAVV